MEAEYKKDIEEMDDEEPDLQEWVTYRKKKIDKKMLGDKYKLVK